MPAILFYMSVLLVIDAIAVKDGLVGIPKEQLPNLRDHAPERGRCVPILFIIAAIIGGWSPPEGGVLGDLCGVGGGFASARPRPAEYKVGA